MTTRNFAFALVAGVVIFSMFAPAATISQSVSQVVQRDGFLNALKAFKAGDTKGAADQLRSYLAEHPGDQRAHYFLARFDLKLGLDEEAIRECGLIKSAVKPGDEKYVENIEGLLKLEDQKKQLNKYLAEMKPELAMTLADEMPLAPREKELIRFEINMAQGNLASAMFRLSIIRTSTPEGSPELDAMERDTRTSAQSFKEISDRLHWYLYSPFCNGPCTADRVRIDLPKQDYSLLEYMRLVANAARLYPLNPWVEDLAFHAALLSASYEDLESFGDRLLEAKGSLRVPFYSRRTIFYLVIDSKKRRIYTEVNALMGSNESGSEEMADLIPFDLGFDQVTEISQKAQSDVLTGSLASGSYALKILPQGLAPHYAFMGLMHCLYGEAKQKEITHNLGAYVEHVLRGGKVHATLVDSHKLTRDWVSASTSALAVGEMLTADYFRQAKPDAPGAGLLADNAMQIVTANREEADKLGATKSAQEEALSHWSDALTHRAFSAIEADRERTLIKDVDKIIGESSH